MAFIALLVAFLLAIAFYALKFGKKWPKNAPPGPPGWPVLGHIRQIDKKHYYLSFEKWARRFGAIYRLDFGSTFVVSLNTNEAIQEALIKNADSFSGRPHLHTWRGYHGGDYGYVNIDGAILKEQRRFALTVLKDLGFGRPIMEERIHNEIAELIDRLAREAKTAGKVDVSHPLKVSIANVTTEVQFGKTFAHDDPSFKEYQIAIAENVILLQQASFMEFLPFSWLWLDYTPVLRQAIANREKMVTFFEHQILQHEKDDDHTSSFSDFTEAYLKKMKELEGQPGHYFTKKQLVAALHDLFIAGFETSVTTLLWAILYLCKAPDVQEAVYREVAAKIGRRPHWHDRNALPYTNAVIMEVQRLANIVPLGVFHRNMEACQIQGYDIPKDTMIVINMWAAMRDEKIFPEPDRFDPGRFLDPQGVDPEGLQARKEAVIPFSLGKRACLGEGLARMELFLFLTALLLEFKISFPPGELPDMEPRSGITLAPQNYSVVLKRRE